MSLALTGAALSSCKTVRPESAASQTLDAANAGESGGPRACVAMRGNGNLIFAHFAALARLVELGGLFDGGAGGSSGSISLFLYESIYANPDVHQCADGACSPDEAAARAALLLKSLQGYLAYLGNTDEARALTQLAPLAARIKAEGIPALLQAQDPQARAALVKLLSSQDLRDLINPDLLSFLNEAKNPTYAARQVADAITNFGNWAVTDDALFFRPSLFNFKLLARKIGRIGNFYASYGPADKTGMEHFLAACATPSRGKTWQEIQSLSAGPSGTCGDTFNNLLGAYRTKLLANEAAYPSRIDDPVGKYLKILIGTAVLDGDKAVQIWQKGRDAYLAGQQGGSLGLNFDLVRFGYWGQNEDLQQVGANPRGYKDLKTSKFLPLGEATWAYVLSYSPAEPGLSPLQKLSETRLSAGGWSDLHPVLVLKNLGCKEVVYVTRRGDESSFATGVAKQLGMSPAQEKSLFALDRTSGEEPSSFLASIAAADGVWCTDWNHYDTPDIVPISSDAYNAPFEVHTPALQSLVAAYPHVSRNLGIRGCSVNAPPASTN